MAVEQAPPAMRDAAADDAPALAALMNELARATGASEGQMTAETVLAGPMAIPSLRLRVAETAGERTDSRVLGYTLTQPAYETAFAARGRYLCDLAVAQAARRRGIGQALLRDAARLSAAEGGVYLWWVVLPSNLPALALYDRYDGVRETPQCRAIHGPTFDALVSG